MTIMLFAALMVGSTGDGSVVAWHSSINADRFIVERHACSRFRRTGCSTSASSTFEDGAATNGAASKAYRVIAKTQQGATVASIPCPLQSSPNFSCTVTKCSDGTFKIEWSAQDTDQGNDVILRRSVQRGGTLYWPTRTTSAEFTDSTSPTGQADYEIYARTNGKISAYTSCSSEVSLTWRPLAGFK